MSRTQRTKNRARTERDRRSEILSLARMEADHGNVEAARALFALVGVDGGYALKHDWL